MEFGYITSVKYFINIVSENQEVSKQWFISLYKLSINLRTIIKKLSYNNHVHFFQKYTINIKLTVYKFMIFLKMMNKYKKII